MACRDNEELQRFVEEAKKVAKDGKVASYIPALAKADQTDLSVGCVSCE